MLSQCVAMGREQASRAEGGAAVAVIGNTGAGKSTFVNYLHCCEMERVLKAIPSSLLLQHSLLPSSPATRKKSTSFA